MAELERHAAEDERQKHGDERRIERRQQHRIGQRKGRHQAAATEHQPGLVAVPDRRNGGDHRLLVLLRLCEGREDADAEVEAVEHHIGEDREGEDAAPHDGKIERGAHSAPPPRPSARTGAIPAMPEAPVASRMPTLSGSARISRRRYQMPLPNTMR